MFDHFYRNGGNIFDTAYIYNFGKSDKYLGEWIKTNDLSKDVMVLGKGAHTPDCEPKFIKPQLEESLDRLMLDRMDIYCLHRDNADIPSGEFIDALNEVRDEGLISYLGASNWTLERFSEANEFAQNNDKVGFKVLSNNFSLANMNEPVWPGCVHCHEEFLDYLIENDIFLSITKTPKTLFTIQPFTKEEEEKEEEE